MITQSGTSQSNCCDDLDRDRLLALEAQRVHRVREVDALAPRRAAARSPCSRRSRCRARARARRSRAAARAAPSRSCRAAGAPTARMPAAAQYAASAAEVSPVDAHAIARIGLPCAIICLTTLTSTVMPRSLNEPVWLLPHSLTHRSSSPSVCAVALGPEQVRAALVAARRRCRRRGAGATHSFLPHTPVPYGQRDVLVALVEQLHPCRRRCACAARRGRARPRAARRTWGSGR